MPRYLKIIFKILGAAFGFVLLLWLGIAAYVTVNRRELLETVTAQLNDGINGKLTIENMEPALIQGFPGISVALKNVTLRDSLYEQHRHNLLEAKEVFVALNIFSLIGGNTIIQKLSINEGKIYMFTDSLGNSNTKIFNRGSKGNRESKEKQINSIEFKNVSFTQDNQQRKKLLNFDIYALTAKVNYNEKGWRGNVNINTKVNSLTFNLKRGSFIKNQLVKTNLKMTYDDSTDMLTIPLQDMSIGEEDFKIGGNFRSTEKSSDFTLTIAAPEIELKNVLPLLATNISSKLAPYKLTEPFSAQAIIHGSLKKKGDPKITVTWDVKDNTLIAMGETVNNCSFTGYFNNEFTKGFKNNDANSVLGFVNLKGTYHAIPFNADTVKIINLRKPVLEGHFRSAFALEKLNAISGSKSFHFHDGFARLNILYRAPYNRSTNAEPSILGTLSLSNATLNYHPRNLDFTGINGLFRFRGQDLFVENLRAKSKSSSFVMNGSLVNFLNLYYTDPKKIQLDWHVSSPQINLGEFLAFLGKRKSAHTETVKNKSASKIFNQLDKIFDEANAHLEIKAGKLNYRQFEATNVHSSILLKSSGMELRDISLNHADGRLKITGNVDQTSAVNRFNIDTRIINVNLTKLFYAFENFGQDAIAYQNLRGSFNSRTKVSGLMRENGQIVPKSFNGSVSFDIKDGALLNFEPMEKVGKFAFPNRDFSNIRFTSLQNTLDIKGSNINIRPMTIESSVLNVSIEGTFGMPTGTDIALRIPLRNPKRDIGLSDSLKRKRFDNGIVINLRGRDDENGNVKFKLGKKDEDDDIEKEIKAIEKEEKAVEKAEKKEEKALRRAEKEEQKAQQ